MKDCYYSISDQTCRQHERLTVTPQDAEGAILIHVNRGHRMKGSPNQIKLENARLKEIKHISESTSEVLCHLIC